MQAEERQLSRSVHEAFSTALGKGRSAEEREYAAEMFLELLMHDEEADSRRQLHEDEEQLLLALVENSLPDEPTELCERIVVALLAAKVGERFRAWQAAQSLTSGPGGAQLAPGDRVLAVLAEDGEYHPAVVVDVVDTVPGSEAGPSQTVVVNFVEFGAGVKVTVSRRDVVALADVADEDDEDGPFGDEDDHRNEADPTDSGQHRAGEEGEDGAVMGRGQCQLCSRRSVRITAHHLIPRQVHAKYLNKGFAKEELWKTAALCRACHSAVHRTEDNSTLAEQYRSIAALRAHPALKRWAAYAAKLRRGTAWDHAVLVHQRRK